MAQIRWTCMRFGTFIRSLERLRSQVPVMFDVMAALLILCLLLVADIVWLGRVHTQEMNELEQLHTKDLGRFRKQHDSQMHDIHSQHEKLGSDLESAHAEEVQRLKVDHHQELEKKIASIQEELNGLISLSKKYWERHVEQHHVEIQFQAPELDQGENKEGKR